MHTDEKLILLASIFHRSLQLIIFLSSSCPHIHCPCLARETAFALLAVSSCCWTSLNTKTTNFLHSDIVTLCQVGLLATKPKPPPCWIFSTMSLCLRAEVACCTASEGGHFRTTPNFFWNDVYHTSNFLGLNRYAWIAQILIKKKENKMYKQFILRM